MPLSISDIINISLTGTPQGLANFNVNNVALFSNDTCNFADEYRIYLTASDVATDWGSSSLTNQMAIAAFSQLPNLLSGNGSLIIIPLHSSISATQGSFETPDISANLTNLESVTNGGFRITYNGNHYDITGINLINANSIADVASIIQRFLTDIIVTADINSTSGVAKILFKSKKVGSTSAVSLSSIPSGFSGTDLTGINYLHQATGASTSGANSSGEKILDAIVRTESQVFYDGILSTLLIEDSVIRTTSNAVQTRDKMWFVPIASTEDFSTINSTDGIALAVQKASNFKTRFLYYSTGIQDSQLWAAGYVGRALSVNFNGSNTAITMNLKDITTIDPDPIFDTTQAETILAKAQTAGVDIYANVGIPGVISTGGNKFFDNVYNDIWLKLALQVAGFNYLKQTNTKVPQEESGMDGLKDAYERVLDQAIRNRVLAKGLSWQSPDTFGNPEDLYRNITQKGYYIYSQPLAQQDEADRIARKAPLIQIAVKRSGAIHKSDSIINVND